MARDIHFKNGWVMRAPLHAGGAQRIMATQRNAGQEIVGLLR